MSGIRASARRLRGALRVTRPSEATEGAPTGKTALLAHAIYRRENSGLTTSLRQVHHIVDIGQPEALRLMRELEADGKAIITYDIHDALESQIKLTASMRDRLTKILGPNAI